MDEEQDIGTTLVEEVPAFSEGDYDPSKDRENMRGTIAIVLISILASEIGASFVFIWIHPDRSKDLHDLLTVVFGPLIALVGAATGYYYAGNKK